MKLEDSIVWSILHLFYLKSGTAWFLRQNQFHLVYYLIWFSSFFGFSKYSSRHLSKNRSTATVLDCPDSPQKRSSFSLIAVSNLIFKILASFFCLGIRIPPCLQVLGITPLTCLQEYRF